MELILNQISDFIANNLMASASIIALVIEFALRLFKSDKPLSILYMIASIFKKVGSICSSIGAFLDKVLPQKLK